MSGSEQAPVIEVSVDAARLQRVVDLVARMGAAFNELAPEGMIIDDMIQAAALFATGVCVACDRPADDLLAALRRCDVQTIRVAIDTGSTPPANGN